MRDPEERASVVSRLTRALSLVLWRCSISYALSREQNNAKGGKMYIQDKLEENADEVFTRLQKGAHIYFCGLKVRFHPPRPFISILLALSVCRLLW